MVFTAYGAGAGLSKLALALFLCTGAASAQALTLLAFGDSLTQGYGLPADQGFTAQLEDWLQEHGADVTVLNGGVSGDTTAGGAARIEWALSGGVDAVIVALGGNDALRGLPAEDARKNLAAILDAVQARGLPVLLVGISAPGNFGAEYQARFEALYTGLAARYAIPLVANFLQGLEDIDDRKRVLRDFMQADALHPNAAGVALVVAQIGPEVLKLLEGVE